MIGFMFKLPILPLPTIGKPHHWQPQEASGLPDNVDTAASMAWALATHKRWSSWLFSNDGGL